MSRSPATPTSSTATYLASGVVPQISVIVGPCAGGAVYSPAITDFVFMVEETSHMFITGPDVIKNVTGEDVTFEDLGGAATHNTQVGVAHFSAPDEETCFDDVRYLLSFLPENNLESAPYFKPTDDPGAQGRGACGPDPRLPSASLRYPQAPYERRCGRRGVLRGAGRLGPEPGRRLRQARRARHRGGRKPADPCWLGRWT